MGGMEKVKGNRNPKPCREPGQGFIPELNHRVADDHARCTIKSGVLFDDEPLPEIKYRYPGNDDGNRKE